MATTAYNQFVVDVPMGRDTSFLKDLTKRMGWTIRRIPSRRCPSGQLLKAMEEVRRGDLIDAADAADVIKKCLE